MRRFWALIAYIIYSSSPKIDEMMIKFPASTKQWLYLLYGMYKFVLSDMVPTGPWKREKSLNLKNKIPGLEKSLIFVKNINKPGKVHDFDQPVMFCCWS